MVAGEVVAPSVLTQPLTEVLGTKTAHKLTEAFGYHTVGEMLGHLPRRYAQRGELTDLAQLRLDEHVTVQAQVLSVSTKPMAHRRGSLTEVVLGDGQPGEATHTLKVTFFNQKWREKQLQPGVCGLFAGKVTSFRNRLQLAHPEYVLFDQADPEPDADSSDDSGGRQEVLEAFGSGPIPLYPATAGVQSWQLRTVMRTLLPLLGELEAEDPLPARVRQRHGLLGLADALRALHHPAQEADWQAGRARLRWQEAFVLQTVLEQRRAALRAQVATPRRAQQPHTPGLLEAFDARLPFALTPGQREVGEQIASDLAQNWPMHRLLQGDVGSGKTVVALRAMLTVVDAGGQAALLAPTEVLAYQHYRSITALLGPLAQAGQLGAAECSTGVVLLTGSATTGQRRQALLAAANGQAGLVIGTHALLQDPVDFADLGLVVVDEQHRFGVQQRDALRAKAARPPHVLVMTATPIPRTVAMTVFGDLDVSTLTQLPAGRQAIQTTVVPVQAQAWMDRLWQRVREEVAAGHRVYVVCPRIGAQEGEEDAPPVEGPLDLDSDPEGQGGCDEAGLTGVLDLIEQLRSGPLSDLRVQFLHGRMPATEKDQRMRDFAAGLIDVLVSTTVIEVGVDVAQATVMVIMDAQRFGISQLHQLRGRVGRGGLPGLCLLVTTAEQGSPTRQRLEAVAATTDGFELANLDLQARREGDVLGASQSGRRSSLRMLSVLRDEKLIARAKQEAHQVVTADPTLSTHPALAAAVAAAQSDHHADYLAKG